MKKGFLTFSFILIWLSGITNPNDSLFVSSKEYQTLNEKIIQIENAQTKIVKEIERVDCRITDWYTNLAIGSGIFILLLGGLIGFQWSNTSGIAKKEAEEELKDLKEKYDTMDKLAKSLELRYQKHEKLLNALENYRFWEEKI
ncbi:MAG: hypothetical protein COZ21_00115 [Bacteroidetes bacterium CG_4_10_14_3_um_filter_31_20]|nr:hypothetical protein [Bacteroidota bacterium]PIX33325.1 MAG: hypothetical protein COZ59_09545 [Bacteroidetes bacterium CG_4_8_14_3_um_filter_31_14]PIY07476.1 MAG: hypothetical protein COZ21_00115 [Bacteroidetes bacterium CG_4_10_14_3_um_filter_31_20]